MYVGRIAVVGKSQGRSFVAYRVSSRSFPNRRAEIRGKSILVSPSDVADLARNPYIAYNCIRVLDNVAVVANGMQADMILEKIEDGLGPLQAIGFSLVAFGYERDELDTPRLAGAVSAEKAWLGIAKRDETHVKEFHLRNGDAFMVATYERTELEPISMGGTNPDEIAKAAYDLSFERPVCSAAAIALPEAQGRESNGFELAVYNPR
ncbi:IMP cyclohydrolase [uncultured archaeon]|nr:IMP cyclohydrolase [uncultured archaeon]